VRRRISALPKPQISATSSSDEAVVSSCRRVRVSNAAELETVGQAVGSSQGEDALRTLCTVAETIGSPDFDATLSQARMKVETAVALHVTPEEL
jgi:hypothetical protein